MKLTLGFSPCPNDTYIFDALVNGQIDTGGVSFEIIMEDVQTLNELAIQGKTDITKISYGSLPLVMEKYVVLDAGGALGKGVGPLLISRFPIPASAIKQCTIAIPGQHTTANVLFSLAYPEATNKVFLRYDMIEDFVLEGSTTFDNILGIRLGVIIHENRFTYQDKGLVQQTDLGSFWENETGLPVPLGGIVARRDLPWDVLISINGLIKKSIEHAHSTSDNISPFIKTNAMEMDDAVIRQHIALYVNDHSMGLGEKGKEAVKKFIQVHSSINKIPVSLNDIFLL